MTNARQEHEAGMPDPSTATTAQLLREISSLKEVVFTRLDGMDRAIDLFNQNMVRVPTDTDKQVGHLKELFLETFATIEEKFATVEEKFASVEKQFIERDTRVKESAVATSTAVAAALQAAKEAVGEQNKSFTLSIDKSEAATTKQTDALKLNNETALAGLSQTISDQKDRLTRIESLGIGAVTQKAETRSESGAMWMVIGGVLGLVGLLASIGFGAIAIASK